MTLTTSEIIRVAAQRHLDDVKAVEDKPQLLLVGSSTSPFLRSVERLALETGFDGVQLIQYIPRVSYNWRIVVDKDTHNGLYDIRPEQDIDHICTPGTSCVAEAAFEFLFDTVALEGKTVTIVGRGHAVKGLAEKLLGLNATVTVAHSYTKDLYRTMNGQDVVVLATPVVPAFPLANEMVLDIGGTLPKEMVEQLPPGCQYEGRIGKLTNSILLARAAGVYHEI